MILQTNEYKVFAWLHFIAAILIAILVVCAINAVLTAQIIQDIKRQTELIQQQDAQEKEPYEKPATTPYQQYQLRPIDVRMKVTAYTISRSETDNDPDRTAIMERPIPGWTCAVSRDMAHWLGGRVWIEGIGVRRVNDLMHARYQGHVDIAVGKMAEVTMVSNIERKVVFLGKG